MHRRGDRIPVLPFFKKECRVLFVVMADRYLFSFKIKGQIVAKFDSFKKRPQPVVVGLGNGIKLVIVAAAARKGEPQEGGAGGFHQIVHEGGAHTGAFSKKGGAVVVR